MALHHDLLEQAWHLANRESKRPRQAVVSFHPKATRAYAWSSPVEGSDKRRFFAVLQLGAIKSPLDAVRAAIVAEHRRGVS